MSVSQETLPSLLALITPRVLQQLIDERGLSAQEAAAALYGSRLYRALEREDTKLWHLSAVALTGLLEEELETGHITWPEEQ
ncbi:MAG: hypothetical protein LBE08_02925 [Bifidobacteriaceae bacterium]|jgi:hypothetical protein|nr:hypothetical protein [Bifidobacteriaceae bacterium]